MTTIENIVFQLAFYYRESLIIDQDGKVPNPIVTEAIKWFKSNFQKVETAQRFAEKVKNIYKPTAAAPFPLNAHFNEISFVEWTAPEDYAIDENKRHGEVTGEVTMDGALLAFAEQNDAPLNAPEGVDIDLKRVWEESRFKEDFTGALRKFGIMNVWEAYREYFRD
jgi:hypothetical protein